MNGRFDFGLEIWALRRVSEVQGPGFGGSGRECVIKSVGKEAAGERCASHKHFQEQRGVPSKNVKKMHPFQSISISLAAPLKRYRALLVDRHLGERLLWMSKQALERLGL